jgi:hypothetical protein
VVVVVVVVVVIRARSRGSGCTAPCFLEVPTVAARCLHVLRDARDQAARGGTLMGEKE